MLPLARSGAFHGRFLSLGGRLSPLDNIGPAELRLRPLWDAMNRGEVREVILALGSEVEGEATAHYIAGFLQEKNIAVTRLAQGIPAGSSWETSDEATLARAVRFRRPLDEQG
jgi:recombination protein RecR